MRDYVQVYTQKDWGAFPTRSTIPAINPGPAYAYTCIHTYMRPYTYKHTYTYLKMKKNHGSEVFI